MTKQDAPEAATMSTREVFHSALNGYLACDGKDYNTTRRLFEDAHWVRNLNKEVPHLAKRDLGKVMGDDAFQTWAREGYTYASASRLIRAKLAPVVNGRAA